jgi:hypothetical protein
MTQDNKQMTYNIQQHTTHLQPYDQLLMGWIAGGMAIMMMGSTMRGGLYTSPHILVDSMYTIRSLQGVYRDCSRTAQGVHEHCS